MSRITDHSYRRIIIWLIIAVGLLLYAHTLPFPFVWDGRGYIMGNPLIKSFRYYDDIFKITQFAQLDDQLGIPADFVTNFALRPVTYLTFSVIYLLGGISPIGYRACNIAIHIVNAVLIFLILRDILKKFVGSTTDNFSYRFIPAATAFLFLVHPLQTESVIYIVQRFTSLAASFYLLTAFLYLSSLQDNDLRPLRLPYWASVATLLAGMMTKETVLTAPLILLAMELIILKTSWKLSVRRTLPHLLCLPYIPSLVMVTSAAQSSSHLSVKSAINVINFYGYSVGQYAITQLCAITMYIRLLLFPYGQNADYDYPLYTSLIQGRVLLSIMVISLIVAGSILIYRSNPQDKRRALILFGTAFFFISISVTSSIIPMAELVAERRTYLPSFGAFLAIVSAVDLWCEQRSPSLHKFIIAGIAVWVAILCGATYARSYVWSSRTSFWQDAASKSPNKVRTILGLVEALWEKKQYEQAISWQKKAIAANPDNPDLYILLQELQYLQGLYVEAIDSGVYGLSLGSQDPRLYYFLGLAYSRIDFRDDAEQAFIYAITQQPEFLDARLALAEFYSSEGRYLTALELYRTAAKMNPHNKQILERIHALERKQPQKKKAVIYDSHIISPQQADKWNKVYSQAYVLAGNCNYTYTRQ